MTSSAQYSALTRLLTHNNRVHQLEDLLLQMPAPIAVAATGGASPDVSSQIDFNFNPIADLQEDIAKEVRASLVACWFAMPRELDDLEEA